MHLPFASCPSIRAMDVQQHATTQLTSHCPSEGQCWRSYDCSSGGGGGEGGTEVLYNNEVCVCVCVCVCARARVHGLLQVV